MPVETHSSCDDFPLPGLARSEYQEEKWGQPTFPKTTIAVPQHGYSNMLPEGMQGSSACRPLSAPWPIGSCPAGGTPPAPANGRRPSRPGGPPALAARTGCRAIFPVRAARRSYEGSWPLFDLPLPCTAFAPFRAKHPPPITSARETVNESDEDLRKPPAGQSALR